MRHGRLVLTLLLLACLSAPHVRAQGEEADTRRWTIRTFYSLPDTWAGFNSRGLVDFLETNGFDDASTFLGRTVDYPSVWTENASWSFYAAYAAQPRLSVGGLYYKAQYVNVGGFRSEPETSFDIDLEQTMWAVAPFVLWAPVDYVDIGAGPAFIRGGTAPYEVSFEQRIEAQETTFQRLGGVLFVSLGFTVLDRSLYLGLQGQFLYGGTVEMGPYQAKEWTTFTQPLEQLTLETHNVRIDQLTMGPVIAINF
jgi:hypothetical protein